VVVLEGTVDVELLEVDDEVVDVEVEMVDDEVLDEGLVVDVEEDVLVVVEPITVVDVVVGIVEDDVLDDELVLDDVDDELVEDDEEVDDEVEVEPIVVVLVLLGTVDDELVDVEELVDDDVELLVDVEVDVELDEDVDEVEVVVVEVDVDDELDEEVDDEVEELVVVDDDVLVLVVGNVVLVVVGTTAALSNAPRSQPRPTGRAAPRWSVAGQVASTAVSIAGLPTPRACVFVAPPLSASAPRSGSVFSRSVPATKLQLASDDRLPPPDMMPASPAQSARTFPAMIVFVIEPGVLLRLSPRSLPVIVTLSSVAEFVMSPDATIANPPVLPEKVEFVTMSVVPTW